MSPQHAHALHREAEVLVSHRPRPPGSRGETGTEAASGGGTVKDAGVGAEPPSRDTGLLPRSSDRRGAVAEHRFDTFCSFDAQTGG